MGELTNRVALVTGASRSIGRAIALKLASMGARVVVNYQHRAADAAAVVAEIKRLGGEAFSVQADMASVPDIRRLFAQTLDQFGRLDIVIANAGILPPLTSVVTASEADFDRAFAVNTRGVFFVLQQAAQAVAPGGCIVHVSSSSTLFPNPGFAVYAGSKLAPKVFVEVLAKELGPRQVRVNSVVVGATDAGFLEDASPEFKTHLAAASPAGRMGQVEDAANAVSLLVRDEAQWINGQHLLANGGATV